MFCCSRKPQGGPPESVAAMNFFINVYIQYLIVLYVVALYLYRPLNILVLTENGSGSNASVYTSLLHMLVIVEQFLSSLTSR